MGRFSRFVFSSLVLFILFLSFSEARDHLIGGKSNAWKVSSYESDSLNHWAEKARFQVDDSLVWKFDESKDSVLQVARRDYVTCNTSSPIETYTDGNMIVMLERSGQRKMLQIIFRWPEMDLTPWLGQNKQQRLTGQASRVAGNLPWQNFNLNQLNTIFQ